MSINDYNTIKKYHKRNISKVIKEVRKERTSNSLPGPRRINKIWRHRNEVREVFIACRGISVSKSKHFTGASGHSE